MAKKYQEMNAAEKMIVDQLQIVSFERINARRPHKMTNVELLLRYMAAELDLID